ncbi:hypothetical protein [Vampirovibrio sp.]|uniref:hypothetical protein n=1 Tax=Vampirovibrio sp. TaxID=2717857 RepID=UPI0035931B61
MNFYNSYLQGVNQTIGEHSRYARQFQAGQGKTGTQSGATTATPTPAPDQNPATDPTQLMNLLLTLFQMMGGTQDTATGTTGTTTGTTTATTPPPYVPGLTNPPPPAQNPAVASIESKLSAKANATDPNSAAIILSPADVASLRADLQSGKFSAADLGEALMYKLDQAPDKNRVAIGQLIQAFTNAGELNISAFLQNDYLLKLSPARQETLMNSIQQGGLELENGKPNGRLIGFMLDNLSKPGDPQSKAFIQQLLQNLQITYAKHPQSSQGKLLAQLMTLGGISVGDDNALIFQNA